MRLLARELVFAARLMLRSPAFTLVSVAALAMAIAACTVIYSVVYAVVLQPLPYPNASQIVRLNQLNNTGQRDPFSDLNFEDVRTQTRSFAAAAEFSAGTTSILAGTLPLRALVSPVSQDVFDVFSVSPARGRRFVEDELREGGPRAAIVSARFWREHYDGVRDLAEARLRVNGDPHTIVGVMPDGFDFPSGFDIWTPREARPRNPFRRGQNWQVIARIRPELSLDAARADATQVARRLKQQYGSGTGMTDVSVIPLQEVMTGQVRPILFVLLTAVVFLLLVGCANLANVLLARTSVRRRELAVRSALGASGWSLIAALVAESLIVTICGGIVGLALAVAGMRALSFADLSSLPRAGEIALRWPVLAFSVGLTWLTGLLLSVAAGLQARRADAADWLRDGQRGQSSGGSITLLRRVLVVAQLVISVVLLVGAGLLGRSLATLLAQDVGFRREALLTIQLSAPGPRVRPTPTGLQFDDPSSLPRQASLNERLLERLRAIPGVIDAGGVSYLPLSGGGSSAGTFVIQRPTDNFRTMQDLIPFLNQSDRTGHADFRVASGGYFRAMGIPLVRGRLFEERDGADAPHVALITESLATSRWRGRDPIGEQIQFGGMDGDLHPLTIIGIVGDVKEGGLDATPLPTLYAEYRQRPLGTFTFTIAVQTATAPLAVVADARRVISEIAPDVPPRFETIDDLVARSVAARRLSFALTMTFAIGALLVAVLGIYGVLSYLVAQRRHEFGVRIALGARWTDVQRLVLGEASRLIAIGLAGGLAVAFATSRFLSSLLFEIRPTDAVTYVSVSVMLAVAALLACEVPAVRATRVDPAKVLRG